MDFSREIHKRVVREAAVTTNSYVAGNIITAGEYNALGLEVAVTKGSADSIEVKVEESQDGTNYYQQASESASSGTISSNLAERQFTEDGDYAILINPIRAEYIKVSVKSTGTATGSEVAINAYTSWA